MCVEAQDSPLATQVPGHEVDHCHQPAVSSAAFLPEGLGSTPAPQVTGEDPGAAWVAKLAILGQQLRPALYPAAAVTSCLTPTPTPQTTQDLVTHVPRRHL